MKSKISKTKKTRDVAQDVPDDGGKTKTVSQKLTEIIDGIQKEIVAINRPKSEILNERILLCQLVAQIETLRLIEDRGGF